MFLDSLCGFTWAAFLKRDVKQNAPSGPGDCVGTFKQIDETISVIRKAAYFMTIGLVDLIVKRCRILHM